MNWGGGDNKKTPPQKHDKSSCMPHYFKRSINHRGCPSWVSNGLRTPHGTAEVHIHLMYVLYHTIKPSFSDNSWHFIVENIP